ncbi:minor tail protein [Microbacterium phage DannyDe]|nr:minor tail protein [Microbacterium phage DannyDe]
MTMTSWPYVAQDTTDIEYGRLFREMAASDGMVGSFGDTTLRVTGDSSGRQVKMASGSAILRGYMFYSTAVETIAIAANAGAARVDLIVLELNLSAPTVAERILPKVLQGVSGSSTPPSVTQTDTGIYQIPLATVAVANGAAVINAGDVVDVRSWMDQKYGTWTTARRPVSPRKYKLGFNETLGVWEYHNGSTWVSLSAVDLGSSQVSGVLPIAKGGTGGSSQANARTALSVPSVAEMNAALANYTTTTDLNTALSQKAALNHTHGAEDITSGTLPIVRGGTGATTWEAARQALNIYAQASQPAYAAGRIWIKTA